MRTLKEHILERLKVSTAETPMMTNREFFELLQEYINITKDVVFIPAKLCWYNPDEMPKYSKDKTRYIDTIRPYIGRYTKFILELKDIYEGKWKGSVEVIIDQDGNDILDFTDEDWLNKIIKHMQETIKK